jgi:hypothetical protein
MGTWPDDYPPGTVGGEAPSTPETVQWANEHGWEAVVENEEQAEWTRLAGFTKVRIGYMHSVGVLRLNTKTGENTWSVEQQLG